MSRLHISISNPYDGKAIGDHIPDAIQNITGAAPPGNGKGWRGDNNIAVGDISGAIKIISKGTGDGGYILGNTYTWFYWDFDASRVARTANETRVASESVWYGISY